MFLPFIIQSKMFKEAEDHCPQWSSAQSLKTPHFQFLDAAFKKKMETFDLFSVVTEKVFFNLKSILLTSECNSGYFMGSPFGFLIIGVQPKTKSIDRNLYVGSFVYVF